MIPAEISLSISGMIHTEIFVMKLMPIRAIQSKRITLYELKNKNQ